MRYEPRETVICFDLGGVLAQICTCWGQAMEVAGLTAKAFSPVTSRMSECPGFDAYQEGRMDEGDYYDLLANFIQVDSREEAARAHAGILVKPYPGTETLVDELLALGFSTGCLSNTNAPHFKILTDPARFPAIAKLRYKVASHEVKMEKPKLEIYRAFESVAGVPGEKIVYFEDTLVNVEGALAAGWNAFLINPADDPARQMREALTL